MEKLSAGLAHVGIPTLDYGKTLEFYGSLGFDVAGEFKNPANGASVAFLQLGDLVLEVYEEPAIAGKAGAVDHIALQSDDIEETYKKVTALGYENIEDGIQFLPFWEHGVRFFIILGPNNEKVEFCQRLNG